MLPAGDWLISLGFYCVLQYLDPVTSTWQMSSSSAYHRGMIFVTADGFTQRIANLTGCVVSASVANAGTGYVQATTTITAISTIFNGAVPTLLPIVGGALNISGGTLVANGAGYGIAPIVMIPPPPPPQVNANGVGGIQASAFAVIASGTVSSVSITNPGAGYPTAPIAVIVPSPFDPNLTTGITNATVAFTLASAGLIMGALVTNNGSPLANGSLASVTLSVGGAGSSGSLTANVLQTVVSGTLSSAGTGLWNHGRRLRHLWRCACPGRHHQQPRVQLPRVDAATGQHGGYRSVGQLGGARRRFTTAGLFQSAPSFSALGPTVGGVFTIAGLTAVMGSKYDIAVIQPGP